MSTHNIHFMKKQGNFLKMSMIICFLVLSREFLRDSKKDFELAMVNELSEFELFRFYSILILKNLSALFFMVMQGASQMCKLIWIQNKSP